MLQFAALPAERMRGARLVEDFRDALTVAQDGWAKASLPVFDDGGTFDGVDDSITQGDILLGVNGVSFWVTLVSASEEILTLSAAHSVSVAAGVVTATGWAAPTIYVNGAATTAIGLGRSFVTIVTATSFTADTVIVGKIAAAFGAFKIERLAIWATSSVLTLAEHRAYYNQTMFNWRNRATVDLRLRMQDYDPTNVRTLDSSGRANHFTLGDGATAATFPAQGNGRMTFDGGDYLARAAVAQPTGAFSVAMTFDDVTTPASGRYLAAHSDAATTDVSFALRGVGGGVYRFYVGTFTDFVYTGALPTYLIKKTFVAVWNGSTALLYYNGVLAVAGTNGAPAQPSGAAQPINIGQFISGANKMTGTIYDFKYFDGLALNNVQAMDYTQDVLRRIGTEI